MGPLSFTHVWDFVRYCDENFEKRVVLKDPDENSERVRATKPRPVYGPYPKVADPIPWNGESRTIKEWAALFRVSTKVVAGRIQRLGSDLALTRIHAEVTGLAAPERRGGRSRGRGPQGTTA